MFRDRFLKRLFTFGFVMVVGLPMILGQLSKINPMNPVASFQGTTKGPVLSESRKQHILYGDDHGGGHLHGINRPCKSEFPANWSADDVVAAVKADAANDNLGWRQQGNGYYVADANDHGVKIRIVLNRDKSEIITAYPLNTPRSPCNAANDNGE
ncbi:MAG: EndoU domain-containing protein [Micavibrio sp.]|nr:EndoU domain-containing protein [Micavibrio sp.]